MFPEIRSPSPVELNPFSALLTGLARPAAPAVGLWAGRCHAAGQRHRELVAAAGWYGRPGPRWVRVGVRSASPTAAVGAGCEVKSAVRLGSNTAPMIFGCD